MAVELFFLFYSLGFKPWDIEKKKSGNVQPDPAPIAIGGSRPHYFMALLHLFLFRLF
jgi:hypothetical protein